MTFTKSDIIRSTSLLLLSLLLIVGVVAMGTTLNREDALDEAASIHEATASFVAYNVTNELGVCNDGSPGQFHVKESVDGSTDWVINLQGGDICEDTAACQHRQSVMGNTVSSKYPYWIMDGGLLSSDADINPMFSGANKVVIHYCSSDVWSGSVAAADNTVGFHFQGQNILFGTLHDLIGDHGLANATRILFTGSPSASGLGVVLNLDSMAVYLAEAGVQADVRGMADSSWFLWVPETDTYNSTVPAPDPLPDWFRAPYLRLADGYELWTGTPLEACVDYLDWRCFYLNNTASGVQTRSMIVQNTQDPEMIRFAGVQDSELTDPAAQTFITNTVVAGYISAFQDTLSNDGAYSVFAPTCYTHMSINNDYFLQNTTAGVGGPTLNEVLDRWYNGERVVEVEEHCMHMGCNPSCPVHQDQPQPPE